MAFDLSSAAPVDAEEPEAAGFDITQAKPADEGFDFWDAAGQVARGAGSAIKEAFTGTERTTESSRALPEMAFSGILSGEDPAIVAKLAPVLLTTLDPAESARIVTTALPHIGVIQDEKGNIILENPKNNAIAMVNTPGMSPTDVLQGAGLAAAYTPAARLSSPTSNVMANMLKVGGGSAATEAGLQGLQSLSGGEFSGGDVALAGGGGAAFEGIFQGLARYFPLLREQIKLAGGRIDDDIRQAFKAEARLNGLNPETITDDVIYQAISPEGAIQDEIATGIPLTRGQRTGNQGQLMVEDDMLTGRMGPTNQELMLQHRARTGTQIDEATGRMQESFGGEVLTPQESGSLIKQGVRGAEAAAEDAFQEAYGAVGDASLKPEGFTNLFREMKRSIRGLDYPVTTETPATKSLLKQINSAEKLFKKPGVTLKPQHVKRIEQIRRSIGAQRKTAKNAPDARNIRTMQESFDDYLDNAVKNALFDGDQEALDALKSSRGLFKDYAQKFRPQRKKTKGGRTVQDPAGNFVDDIISSDPTDTQVINTLFGAGNTFGQRNSVNLANRFKDILGDGMEWDAVRQAGFKRLLKTEPNSTSISPRRTLTAFNEAMKKQPELMRNLYSREEIANMRKFFTHISKTRPEIIRGVANPSGTAAANRRITSRFLGQLTEMLGVGSGNPLLSITGSALKKGSAQAEDAIRPFGRIIKARPELVGGATAITQQANE